MTTIKQKTCKECKCKFTPVRSTLEPVCQEYNCRVAYALKVAEKSKLNKEKAIKKQSAKEKIELKEKLKTLSEWNKDLQVGINAIVRQIDNGWGCIATDTTKGKANAGHYIGTLANPTIRFHLENIWLQSEHSNTWKSGDTIRYQLGIIKLFGTEYLDYMNSLQSIAPIKLSIEEIKEKITIARGILKWLKLQDRQFTLSERVELRKKFNKELGIYKD